MDWNVKNANNRDVERQHLNKILADIRSTLTSLDRRVTEVATTGSVESTVGSMVDGNVEKGISVTYDERKKVLDFILTSFTLSLTGDVTGEATVDGTGDVSIDTNLTSSFTPAPIDGAPYWQLAGQWEYVGTILETLYYLDEPGILALTDDLEAVVREIQGTAGEINVADGTGAAANPVISLADVTDSNTGTLQGITVDGKGRVTGTTDATITAGAGIDVTNGDASAGPPTISHEDTSSVANISSDNSNGVVLQDISVTFDTFGHVQTISVGTVDLDTLYPRDTEVVHNTGNESVAGEKTWTGDQIIASTNTTTSPNQIDIENTSGVSAEGIVLRGTLYSSSSGPTKIELRRARGTKALPTGIGTGDVIFRLDGVGHDGTAFSSGQFQLHGTATENWSATGHGTRFRIRCTPTGSTSFSDVLLSDGTLHITPGADNTQQLGTAALRWKEIFAGNAVINTSDARDKTVRGPLNESELAAARELRTSAVMFQWNEAVASKGEDARLHCSPTVQSVIAIMEKHGLDPFRYGFVCYDEWEEKEEVVDAGTGEVLEEYRPAGNRYSLRPVELMFFIMAGI